MWNKHLTRLDFLKLGSAALAALPLTSNGAEAVQGEKVVGTPVSSVPEQATRKKYPPGGAHQEYMGWHKDEESGAEVGQLTSSPMIHEHIYPEAPIFTPDSRFFVYSRRASAEKSKEYWLCETGTWRLFSMTYENRLTGPVISPDGEYLYYLLMRLGNEAALVRKNLYGRDREEIVKISGLSHFYELGTISPDGRFYATAARLPDNLTGILRIDLVERTWRIIHSRQDIFNAHPQWDPGNGRDILIQHNRGGRLNEFGEFDPMVGPEGATLYLIDSEGADIHELHIGKPYTPSIQGHECWLGRTGKILLTLTADVEINGKKGNLITVARGKEPEVVAGGLYFWHVASSPDGKYFICDDTQGNIYIGLAADGRYKKLCNSGTFLGAQQYTHTHPFLSPDCRFAFFNSTRTGIPQIYAASVSEDFLKSI